MKISEIKHQLHDQIDNAGEEELREMYNLMLDYFNRNTDDSKVWDGIPRWQQERLIKSTNQADAGMGKPLVTVVEKMKNKYGI